MHLRPDAENPFQKEFNELLSTRLFVQPRDYPTVEYNSNSISGQTPDFRPILYWNPLIKVGKDKASIDFYASDDVNAYEIIVEGIGQNGEIIHARKTITVGAQALFSKN